MPINLIIITYSSLFNIFHVYYLFHFVGHIYAVVAPKNNAWGSNYWLACCLDGKKTLLYPIIDDENNEFSMGTMFIKDEYLKLATQLKNKDGYVYQDYRP